MNKPEEIIEELQKLSNYAEILKNPDEYFVHMNGHHTALSLVLCAFDIAYKSKEIIQALEQQIPKDITQEATILTYGTCPSCKNVVRERNQDFNYLYCHFCGQKLS
jgi:hypothetical protein